MAHLAPKRPARELGNGILGCDLEAVTRSISRRLRDLSTIGHEVTGGWTRLGFTETEREAHRLFGSWAEKIGLKVRQDEIGNSYADRAGRGPTLMVGSHLDTVPHGGNFDGAAGVVAAIEAADMLRETHLKHPLTVVCFACEEGARFTSPCIGSRVATGSLEWQRLQQLRDSAGISLFEAAQAMGMQPERIQTWARGAVACYLELHIEQGRVLQESGHRIGIVDTIAGTTRMSVVVQGRSDHSGTTPMAIRRDALVGAAVVITLIEQIACRSRTAVATVGRLQVAPNVITTVPGEVGFSVDVRDIDPLRQREVAEEILHQLGQLVVRRGLSVSARLLHDQSPLLLPYWVREQLAASIEECGVAYKVMPSGAGHDAGYVSLAAPAGMIFVPSREGLSHTPEEWTEAGDIALGAALLAQALSRIDSASWMA